MRKAASAVQSSVPTLIPETCRYIAAFAIAPSNLDIKDDWNKTPMDWAVENMSVENGENDESISTYLTEFLVGGGLRDDWFF